MNKGILLLLVGSLVSLSLARLHSAKFVSEVSESTEDDALWFDQKIDNFNPADTRTFPVRYWDTNEYWDKDNGPLFLHICGEWTCSKPADNRFDVELTKKFKARLFTLEHRYYGKSQPFEDWTTENLVHLTADQGLRDIARFTETISEMLAEEHEQPKQRWVVIGGSYPGAMAAWFRYKYPHIAFASLASSGVVDAVKDFWEFDD
jgi:hypothetical protein